METLDRIIPHYSGALVALMNNELREDFKLLSTAGIRKAIAYSEALRDADNGVKPEKFLYMAELPKDDSSFAAIQQALARLVNSDSVTDMRMHQGNGPNSVHMMFKHQGRAMEVTLSQRMNLCAGTKAQHACFGLAGIAVNELGYCLTTANYHRDKFLKTLTISRDIGEATRHIARQKAVELKKRDAYRNFKIVG